MIINQNFIYIKDINSGNLKLVALDFVFLFVILNPGISAIWCSINCILTQFKGQAEDVLVTSSS